ncbi:MAG: SCO family protein [bacterium]|jgi:protein SCO1/2|nr:SCO family protein [Chitinophagaceae bacterium]
MKKTTLLALLMVTLLPIASYLYVSSLSKDAIKMPRRYFYDTVVVKMEKGKKVNDTVWHKVKPFKLKNQFGKEVGLEDWGGKIIIADFFFTSCPSICPKLTRNMKKLQTAFKKTDSLVRFVSFTVDPVRDTVQALKAYGDKFGIDHDTWFMLTGDRNELYDIALNEFKASIASNGNIDTGFIHTDRFFLLDRDRVVRGWYNGLDSVNLDKLIKDVVLLNMERDKKKKRNLFRK